MPLTYKQVQRILADYEFEYLRQNGSHEQRGKNGKTATVPRTKEFRIKTAKSMLEQIAYATDESYKTILQTYQIKL